MQKNVMLPGSNQGFHKISTYIAWNNCLHLTKYPQIIAHYPTLFIYNNYTVNNYMFLLSC